MITPGTPNPNDLPINGNPTGQSVNQVQGNPVGTTGANSAATSSSAYRTGVATLGGDITTEAGTVPPPPDTSGLTKDFNTAKDNLKGYSDELLQGYKDQVSGINSSFDSTISDTKVKQENENGKMSNTLARIGGYLGPGTAGEGAMGNLEKTHETQIATLQSKRATAINTATSAYNSKNFALAKESLAASKTYNDEINKLNNDYQNTKLKVLNQQRLQHTSDVNEAAKTAAEEAKGRAAAVKLGVNKRFYSTDGVTLIDSNTGKPIKDMDEYKALGGKGDGSDIQMIENTPSKFETKQVMSSDGTTHSVHIGYNAQGQVVSEVDLGPTKFTTQPKSPVNKNGKKTGTPAVEVDPKISTQGSTLSDSWKGLPANQRTLKNWNDGLDAFVAKHSDTKENKAEAAKEYKSRIPKPKK